MKQWYHYETIALFTIFDEVGQRPARKSWRWTKRKTLFISDFFISVVSTSVGTKNGSFMAKGRPSRGRHRRLGVSQPKPPPWSCHCLTCIKQKPIICYYESESKTCIMSIVNSLHMMKCGCHVYFMPIYTFKLVALQQLWFLSLQRVVSSVHISFLQLLAWYRICGVIVARTDKSLIAFNLCCHENLAF